MTKTIASLVLRYSEIRRETDVILASPHASKEMRHEARQQLADARESLAHAVGQLGHEHGLQILFVATGGMQR